MFTKSEKYKSPFKNEGYCYCCCSDTVFSSSNTWYRDHYRCTKCNSIPRERAIMYVIDMEYPEWRGYKIHESSPGNRGCSSRLKKECPQYYTSQYFAKPVYHGNPIDSNGSLVTYHWGYDMIELIYQSSCMVSTIYSIDNLDLGIRAEYIEVVVSRKLP